MRESKNFGYICPFKSIKNKKCKLKIYNLQEAGCKHIFYDEKENDDRPKLKYLVSIIKPGDTLVIHTPQGMKKFNFK